MALKLKTGEQVKSESDFYKFLNEMSNVEFNAYLSKRGDVMYNWIDKKIECPKKCQDLLDATTKDAMLLVLGKKTNKPRLSALDNELAKERKKRIKRSNKVKAFKKEDKKIKIEAKPVEHLIDQLREVYK